MQEVWKHISAKKLNEKEKIQEILMVSQNDNIMIMVSNTNSESYHIKTMMTYRTFY